MHLITTSKFYGPTMRASPAVRNATPPTISQESYATRLPLNDALILLRKYDDDFRDHYKIVTVEHTLVGIQSIPPLTDEALEAARVWTVEGLYENHRRLVAEEKAADGV